MSYVVLRGSGLTPPGKWAGGMHNHLVANRGLSRTMEATHSHGQAVMSIAGEHR